MDITELKRTLKGTFEGLYDYRLHLLRIKQIKKCDKLSSMDKNEYPVLLAKIYEERIGHSLDWNNLRTYTETHAPKQELEELRKRIEYLEEDISSDRDSYEKQFDELFSAFAKLSAAIQIKQTPLDRVKIEGFKNK